FGWVWFVCFFCGWGVGCWLVWVWGGFGVGGRFGVLLWGFFCCLLLLCVCGCCCVLCWWWRGWCGWVLVWLLCGLRLCWWCWAVRGEVCGCLLGGVRGCELVAGIGVRLLRFCWCCVGGGGVVRSA
ncbi:hypothetical protein, partial [Pseudomonas syringae group genomosp. 7]|uniref:hypothetical protein n=1 Tax=Pseudomonas syringae group genomosp. 7 TaxID=251699 RepID=UPI00376FA5C9